MFEMVKANLHVKRHLTMRERVTLAVALELLARAPDGDELHDIVGLVAGEPDLLGDAEIRSLAYELLRARKVKVCRTKQLES